MGNKTIIIADDQDFPRSYVETVCSGLYPNHLIESYSDGKSVEDRFKRGFDGVDLVILDEVMDPGKRGIELIKEYSGKALEYSCKMILFTGEEIEREAREAGARGYLPKDCSLEKMEEIIGNVMAS